MQGVHTQELSIVEARSRRMGWREVCGRGQVLGEYGSQVGMQEQVQVQVDDRRLQVRVKVEHGSHCAVSEVCCSDLASSKNIIHTHDKLNHALSDELEDGNNDNLSTV